MIDARGQQLEFVLETDQVVLQVDSRVVKRPVESVCFDNLESVITVGEARFEFVSELISPGLVASLEKLSARANSPAVEWTSRGLEPQAQVCMSQALKAFELSLASKPKAISVPFLDLRGNKIKELPRGFREKVAVYGG